MARSFKIMRDAARAHDQFFERANVRSATQVAEWANSSDDSESRVSWDSERKQLSVAQMELRKNPVKRDTSKDVFALSVNLDTCNNVSRQEPLPGSFVEIIPSDFWSANPADQKILLASLCRADGARDRMAASKSAGNTARQTINAEIDYQSRKVREWRRSTASGFIGSSQLKKTVKTKSKRDQKAANADLVMRDGGTASFKRGTALRVTDSHSGVGVRKLSREEFGMLILNKVRN